MAIVTKQVVLPDPTWGARVEDVIDLGGTATSIFDSASNKASDFASGAYDKITDTNFLVNGGLALVGGLFASKVSRPSLKFSSLAATTQVALGVGSALKAGAATIQQIASAERGLKSTSSLLPKIINVVDRESDIDAAVRSKSSNEIQFIKFPVDLPTSYSLGLTFYEYEKLSFYKESTVKPRDIIRLPLPLNLVDVISLQYNNLQAGPLRGPFLENLKGFANEFERAQSIERVGELVGETGRNILQKMKEDPGIARVIGRNVIQSFSPSTAAALDLALGNTPNPHATITFNGVNLRAFQFNWRLSPNSYKDSAELKKLIFALKSKTLPRKQGDFLLKFPDYVKLKLYPSTLNDLFNFRTMVVDTFTVNYAPSGSVAFHGDDTPVEVEISMSLREVDIQTSEDYNTSVDKYITTEAINSSIDQGN